MKDVRTGRVVGVRAKDVVDGGREFEVRAKVVLNCTGPFTDAVRKMSDGSRMDIMTPAGGAHLTLPKHFAPESEGLIVPKTKDGRVVFMLPWLGGVIAGTTDALAPVTLRPRASADEVDFILDSIAHASPSRPRGRDVGVVRHQTPRRGPDPERHRERQPRSPRGGRGRRDGDGHGGQVDDVSTHG